MSDDEGDVNKPIIGAIRKGYFRAVMEAVRSLGLKMYHHWCDGHRILCEAIKSTEGVNMDRKTNDDWSPLHFAVEQGSFSLVRALLDKNAPIDARDAEDKTPLHLACSKGNEYIVGELLKSNASVTKRTKTGSTPLMMALEGGHEEIVLMLLQEACATFRNENLTTPEISSPEGIHTSSPSEIHKKVITDAIQVAKYNLLLLYVAVDNNLSKIIELLVSSGHDATTTGEKVGVIDDEDKMVKVIKLLLAGGADVKQAPLLLHYAIPKAWVQVCKLLVENGADTNFLHVWEFLRFSTPLFLCVRSHIIEEGNPEKFDEILELLLAHGADVKQHMQLSDITAFHCAANDGLKESVEIFLKSGIDVDIRGNDDSTPLHWASKWKENTEIIEILCKHKADVNARTTDGCTPLHYAQSAENSVIKALLKYGADINARDNKNQTALLYGLANSSYRDKLSVTTLINSGIDIDAENIDGKTALDIVFSNKYNHERRLDSASQALIEYLIKLEAAGLYLSSKNLDLLDHLRASALDWDESDAQALFNFQEECKEEISKLKNEKLDSRVSLFNVLIDVKNPTYAKNKQLMGTLSRFNFDNFPIYQGVIVANVKNSRLRIDLLNSAQRSISTMLRESSTFTCTSSGRRCSVCFLKVEECFLPSEICEQIVLNLSNTDLKVLGAANENLKLSLDISS